jgi:hypothetical protein
MRCSATRAEAAVSSAFGVTGNSRIRCDGGVSSFISRMRRSSVRGIAILRSLNKKNRHRRRFFWILVSDFVLLLREPAATPPPSGWNG